MKQYLYSMLKSLRSIASLKTITIYTMNIMKRLRWTIIASLIAAFTFSNVALANDYTFAWDANIEPDVEGYMIYFSVDSPGPPYDGVHPFYPHLDSPIDVGNVTEFTVHDLEEGVNYYFVCTAYDLDGFESDFSNEVSVEPSINRSSNSGDGGGGGGGCFISTME